MFLEKATSTVISYFLFVVVLCWGFVVPQDERAFACIGDWNWTVADPSDELNKTSGGWLMCGAGLCNPSLLHTTPDEVAVMRNIDANNGDLASRRADIAEASGCRTDNRNKAATLATTLWYT